MSIAANPVAETHRRSCALRTALLSGATRAGDDSPRSDVPMYSARTGIARYLHGGIAARMGHLLERVGRPWRPPAIRSLSHDHISSIEHIEQLEWLYDRLADRHSQCVLVQIIRARLLDQSAKDDRAIDTGYDERRRSIRRDHLVEHNTRKPWVPYLNRYCLHSGTDKIVVQTVEQDVLETLLLEQYAYVHDGALVRPQAGDVVIDAGSGYGTASIYFANLVGRTGHIFALEQLTSNAAIIGENLILNPRLRERVTIVEWALSDHSDTCLQDGSGGRATALMQLEPWGSPLADARTATIDDLVDEHEIPRVDFIKIDVERTTLQVLKGATRTVRRHRPSLAIVVSPVIDSVVSISTYLDDTIGGFELFLDDLATRRHRAVLFARPRSRVVR